MKSKPSKIGVLLLLSILVISLPQMMNLNVAKASNAAVTYCPNYLEEEDGENDRSIEVCDAIDSYLTNSGDFNDCYYYTWDDVTRNWIGFVADGLEDYYDYVAVFFKGHDTPWSCGSVTHYGIHDYNGARAEDSLIICGNTTQGEHDFVFLWACGTAQWHPGGYCWSCGGGLGHVFSWTHDSTTSQSGYLYPDTDDEVFLGWTWSSTNFVTPTNYNGKDVGYFAIRFYYHLMQENDSVIDALNDAASDAYGDATFTECPLWGSLYVYGNGNQGLP